jgi:UDP-N-acetyl-2-amino-2-deoxyglucuronate dehydrogenase
MKPKFAMAGCGYVSIKHLKAIQSVGGELMAVLSKNDVAGHLDSFFSNCKFFLDDFEFQEYCKEVGIDWLSVISPNYMHKSHIEFGLKIGANVVAEKPLVIDPKDLDLLSKIEEETGKKIFTVLQLRLHKDVIRFKEALKFSDNYYKGNLRYTTPRGDWFKSSWKTQEDKSGGLCFNIGVHLFDLLLDTMGECKKFDIHHITREKANGILYLDNGEITWFLSIDRKDVIDGIPKRCLELEGGYVLNLDQGFTDLHDEIYKNALSGVGYGIEDARSAIELIHNMKESYNTPKGER